MSETVPSVEVIQQCLAILENLANDETQLASLPADVRVALLSAAGRLCRPERHTIKNRNRAAKHLRRQLQVTHERKARASTGIRSARQAAVFSAPDRLLQPSEPIVLPELQSPRNCYICKTEFTKLHFFYDSMCPDCATFNYEKRFQSAPLPGRVALITGARVKIGYQAALMMLRAGAHVIVTTRFPVDAAERYSAEKDFGDWKHRLDIYGLDLRHTPSVELFARHIEHTCDRLDILINNAAQTVRRPPEFYAHLMEKETVAFARLPADTQTLLQQHRACLHRLSDIPALPGIESDPALPVTWDRKTPGIGLSASARLSQIPYTHDSFESAETVFPRGELDADLQQVDLRETNSWRLRLGEIQTAEMIELQLINAIAPFVLCNRLAPYMKRHPTGEKHIVNVTAMEGKFHRFKKEDRHPHTNMAKAALNMLTHTSAGTLAKEGIFMNAVDTGWVTDEDPAVLAKRKQDLHDFQPPLDIVDGAARVCDPFFHGILTGHHVSGKFLKDYRPIDW